MTLFIAAKLSAEAERPDGFEMSSKARNPLYRGPKKHLSRQPTGASARGWTEYVKPGSGRKYWWNETLPLML